MESLTAEPRHRTEKEETISSVARFAAGACLPDWPLEVSLEISNECRLECVMCEPFSALNPRRGAARAALGKDFVPAGLLLGSLDEVLRHALFIHCVGGGEPTILPQFARLLERLAEYEALVDLSTNGMLLTDELAGVLVDTWVHRVVVSFSGATKDDYERVYHGGVFSEVLAGMDRLRDAKERSGSEYPIVEIHSLAFEHQLQSLSEFVALGAAHGVNRIRLHPLRSPGSIPALAGHAALYRPEVEGKLIEAARTVAAQYKIELDASPFERGAAAESGSWNAMKRAQFAAAGWHYGSPQKIVPLRSFPSLRNQLRPEAERNRPLSVQRPADVSGDALLHHLDIRPPGDLDEPIVCFEPFLHLAVRADGRAQGCTLADPTAPELGNALRKTGTEIWKGERVSLVQKARVHGTYPMHACSFCLSQGLAPRHHLVAEKIAEYRRWESRRFGAPPGAHPPALELPRDNAVIAASLRSSGMVECPTDAGLRGDVPSRRLELLASEVQRRIDERCDVGDVVAGMLDPQLETAISGWIWSPLFPELRVTVELMSGDSVVATAVADRFRPAPGGQEAGDGFHGFTFIPPAPCRGPYSVRLASTEYVLAPSGAGSCG